MANKSMLQADQPEAATIRELFRVQLPWDGEGGKAKAKAKAKATGKRARLTSSSGSSSATDPNEQIQNKARKVFAAS